jgi:arsenate reductase
MSYKIYHNPRCSKSRETLQILRENGVEPTVVEYLKETPTKEDLTLVLSQLNLEAESLLRKGEAIFKENYKGKSLSNDQWIEAMVKYPKLIERPIVIKGNKAVLGRPPQKVLELI